MKSYRIALARDGRFEVIESSPERADTAISRHATKDAARQWLEDHLRLASLTDLTSWLGESAGPAASQTARNRRLAGTSALS
jgi:hypothetical protein